MKTKRAPAESKNYFVCQSCGNQQMDLKELKEHLAGAHGINTTRLKIKKSLVMALDGDNWYSNQYEIELPSGLKLSHVISGPREPYPSVRTRKLIKV